MGRPPSNGGPSFRFNQSEIAEMEAILQAHKIAMPAREVLVSLAEKFSNSEERSGKIEVQMKQVWNWFQNRRYAIRAKAGKSPGKLNITQMNRDDSTMVKGVPQPTHPHAASSVAVRSLPQTQHPTVPSATVRTFPQAPQLPVAFSVQSTGRVTDNSQMEYEAKSARDGAWYDVSTFLSHRSIETGDPEVLVRFAGFGAEEDEWVNVRKNVRQRSLPCESSECVAVLPADLILCFQEGKEQALYFDAHVLDAQRRRHDVRGCRCRFLVRYDHDQSEEIVALRKICRRPETDYRLQQLHAVNESLSANQNKNGGNNIHTVSTLRVYPPAEVQQPKQQKVEPAVVVPPPLPPGESPQKRQKVDSTVPEPLPEEPTTVVAAPPGDVPQVQQDVQVEPVLPDTSAQQPSVEMEKVAAVSSAQDSAEAEYAETVVVAALLAVTGSDDVQLEMQKVQPVVADPSSEVSLESKMVAVPSVQDSAELQNVETLAPPLSTGSDEVQPELQKVQQVVAYPSTEVSLEPKMVPLPSVQDSAEFQNVEMLAPPPPLTRSDEVQLELQKVQPVVLDSTEVSLEPKTVAVPSVQDSAESQNLETLAPLPASSDEVQLELQKVQPGVPDPSTEVSLEPQMLPVSSVQDSVETQNVETLAPPPPTCSDEVQPELQKVQPMMDVLSTEASLEPVMVPVPSVQDSAELQNVETLVPPLTGLDEVQLEVQKVQPTVADPLTEVSLEPKPVSVPSVQDSSELQNVESLAPPTASDEVQLELHKVQPVMQDLSTEASVEPTLSGEVSHEPEAAPSAETPVEPNEVAEPPPQKEPMVVSSSSVEVQAELPEVQPATALEGEEPVVAVATNDSNVVEEAIEMETDEPVVAVPTNVVDSIEAEIEQPEAAEIMDIDDGNASEDKHANIAENASNGEAGNSELQSGNDDVTGDMEEV